MCICFLFQAVYIERYSWVSILWRSTWNQTTQLGSGLAERDSRTLALIFGALLNWKHLGLSMVISMQVYLPQFFQNLSNSIFHYKIKCISWIQSPSLVPASMRIFNINKKYYYSTFIITLLSVVSSSAMF